MRPGMSILKRPLHAFGKWYSGEATRREYHAQRFVHINERPIEFGFVFKKLLECCPTTVLDVGTGKTALPHLMRNCGFLVTATDNIVDYWPAGMYNRHYHVINDDITKTTIKETFDFITCISVLEHVKHHEAAVRNMIELLNQKGHLALTFPYSERTYVPNVYKLPDSSYGKDAPYVCQSLSREEIDHWMLDNRAKIVDQEYWRFWEGDFWTCGKQELPPRQVSKTEGHQLTCILITRD